VTFSLSQVSVAYCAAACSWVTGGEPGAGMPGSATAPVGAAAEVGAALAPGQTVRIEFGRSD
jgi:hypothetical protein